MPTWLSCRDCGRTTKMAGVFSAHGRGPGACPSCGGTNVSWVKGPFSTPGANRTMVFVILGVVAAGLVPFLACFGCLLGALLLGPVSPPETTAHGSVGAPTAPPEPAAPGIPPD